MSPNRQKCQANRVIGITAKPGLLFCIGVAGLVAASCTTTTESPGGSNVGNLATVSAKDDPNRIVCKSYKPAGSQREERICMTAGQWDRKGVESE